MRNSNEDNSNFRLTGKAWLKPYAWSRPEEIPSRQWLYGRHFVRRFVTATIGPGGLGKSALLLAEAVCMASGKPLLGIPVPKELRVWYWNGEDPIDEVERRLAALNLYYKLKKEDLDGKLFIGSGRDEDLIIAANTPKGATVNGRCVEAICDMVHLHNLDLIIVDPFVSSHRIIENDNGAVDLVMKTWAFIAQSANVGVELVHHTRKRSSGSSSNAETTSEDSRGAVSLTSAARSVRVLNLINRSEAEKAGIDTRRSYFKVDNGKANLAAPTFGSGWYHLVGVDLGNGGSGGVDNGDNVGVVTLWDGHACSELLSHKDEVAVKQEIVSRLWRYSPQSPDWVGYAVANALNLNVYDESDRLRIKALLRGWYESGALIKSQRKDATSRNRPCVEIGNWKSDAARKAY